MYFWHRLILTTVFAACLSGCGERSPSTPLETFKTYTKAIKQKDTATMKVLLSNESIRMHQQEAKALGVPLDDILKRETLFSVDQTSVEFKNEKIEGDKATLEVKNTSGSWEILPFIKEDGVWKIDKKGYADQMMNEIEQNDKRLDDIINQGRQP